MSLASDDVTSAAPAGVAWETAEPFDAWASRQRRQATYDGAWKVEITEQVRGGVRTRTVISWQGIDKQQRAPSRRAPQRSDSMPDRLESVVRDEPQPTPSVKKKSA